jgi:hypothetical protein
LLKIRELDNATLVVDLGRADYASLEQ